MAAPKAKATAEQRSIAQAAEAPTSANSSGGSHPAGLQLAELNQRSASLGSWDINMFEPDIHEWTYSDKKTLQKRKGAAFRGLLVSVTNPSHYANGGDLHEK